MQNPYRPTEIQREFLEKYYLNMKYHVPVQIDKTAEISLSLLQKYDCFVGLCIVGGLVNGSYALRSMECEAKKSILPLFHSARAASDVDFYLIVDGLKEGSLAGMAD